MSTDTPWPTPLPSPPQDGSPQRLSRRDLTADAVAFGVLTVAGLVVALAVGALWRATAPAVLGVFSQGNAYLAAPEGKTFIARDGWFALYACIAAILLALFAFFRYRKDGGTGAALGLAVGGYAGGYLATRFAKLIGPGGGSLTRIVHGLADGSTFKLPLTIRATGVIWLWPAVAVGLFFFLVLLFGPSEPEPEYAGEPEPLAEPIAGAFPSPNGQVSAGHAPPGSAPPASSSPELPLLPPLPPPPPSGHPGQPPARPSADEPPPPPSAPSSGS